MNGQPLTFLFLSRSCDSEPLLDSLVLSWTRRSFVHKQNKAVCAQKTKRFNQETFPRQQTMSSGFHPFGGRVSRRFGDKVSYKSSTVPIVNDLEGAIKKLTEDQTVPATRRCLSQLSVHLTNAVEHHELTVHRPRHPMYAGFLSNTSSSRK